MATKTPKAIYIGPIPVYDYFVEKLKPEWDFAPAIPDIKSLWDGLENGTVDNDSDVLLILDSFFDEKGEDNSFENLVATMAPYCLLCIVSYRPEKQELIRERVNSEVHTIGLGENPSYYFVSHDQPARTLDSAVEKFAATTSLVKIASRLTGKTLNEDDFDKPQERHLETGYVEDEAEEKSDTLGQVVAVTSSKGGSGKSTVGMVLSSYLAHSSENSQREGLEEKPLKVILVDMDSRDGQIGFLTGNSKPTVIQIRQQGISDESIEKTVIHSKRLKCDLLLAAKRPRTAEQTPPDFYAELIQKLRKKYDYVILDTSVLYTDPLLEKVAYPMADQIVFVTDIVINSIFSMTRWIQEVTKPISEMGMGISRKKIGIVLNKALANVSMPEEKIKQATLGLPIITPIPSNPKIMATAANTQQMDLLLKHEDTYKAIRRLARALVGKKYQLSDSIEK